MRKSFLARCVVACVIGYAVASADQPQQQTLELRVKAGFLYTFVKYVDWPENAFQAAGDVVVIGVLGKDPFGALLDSAVAGKKIEGRAVRVQRVQRVEEIGDCHVLFVSRSEKDRLKGVLASLRGRKILTISDAEGFLQHGGQIQLVTEDRRVRFDINMEAARHAGITLSSHLLRVARYLVNCPETEETGKP